MRHILHCKTCNHKLSLPLHIFNAGDEGCPPLNDGWYDVSIVPSGVCFKSRFNILDAAVALEGLEDKRNSRSIFSKLFKPAGNKVITLSDIEFVSGNLSEPSAFAGFSHLTDTPQDWMNGLDLAADIEVPEISWGWTATNTANIYCPNCESPVGTDVAYSDIPCVFIPDKESTKWQSVKS